MDTQKREFFVAKRGEEYATDGYYTGMGTTIGSTKDVWLAKRFSSPSSIMSSMGGHYALYVAVKMRLESTLETIATEDWPPLKEY